MSDDIRVISYNNEIIRREETAAGAALDAANRQMFSALCDHYALNDTEANFRLIREYSGGTITPETFKVMLEAGQGTDLDWSGTKEKLIEEIMDILSGLSERVMSEHDLKTAATKMIFWEKSKLRARLAELKFKAGKSANDAKTLLVAHRAAEAAANPHAPFETMPPQIGAAEIRAASVQTLKYWGQRYGDVQVRNRLNNR